MAFSYTITNRENLGSITLLAGTYTQGANDAGGVISTGFGTVMFFGTGTNNVDEANAKISTAAGGNVTIVTATGSTGTWGAVGK